MSEHTTGRIDVRDEIVPRDNKIARLTALNMKLVEALREVKPWLDKDTPDWMYDKINHALAATAPKGCVMNSDDRDQFFLPLCIFFGVIAMAIVELIKWSLT